MCVCVLTRYGDMAEAIQDIRDREQAEEDEKWVNQRKKYLDSLAGELEELRRHEAGDTLQELLDFLFVAHPPVHLASQPTKPDVGDTHNSRMRALQKAVTLYHPDRVSREKHGTRYFVLMEEITKCLNRMYNEAKGL